MDDFSIYTRLYYKSECLDPQYEEMYKLALLAMKKSHSSIDEHSSAIPQHQAFNIVADIDQVDIAADEESILPNSLNSRRKTISEIKIQEEISTSNKQNYTEFSNKINSSQDTARVHSSGPAQLNVVRRFHRKNSFE